MIARRDDGLGDALLGRTVACHAGTRRQSCRRLQIKLVCEARRGDGRADPRLEVGRGREPRHDALLLEREPEHPYPFGVRLRAGPRPVESIHEFRWPWPTFIEQKSHDWQSTLDSVQVFVFRNRGLAWRGSRDDRRRLSRSLRRIAVAPGENADISFTAVHHFENFGEGSQRARCHVLHGDHFVPELPQDADCRGAMVLQVLER